MAQRSIRQWHREHYTIWSEARIVIGKLIVVRPKKEIVLVREQLVLEETKIIAKSIPQLLERIIAAESKYYFDAPNFIPDDDLSNSQG